MKEKIKTISNVEESFNGLGLNTVSIVHGSDEFKAFEDAVEIGIMKMNLVFNSFASTPDPGVSFSLTNGEFEIIKTKEEKFKKDNQDNDKYLNTFEKINDWVGKGVFEGGITIGSKVRFLKEKFGIEDEEKKQKRVDLDIKDENDCFVKDSEKTVITFRDFFRRKTK